MFSQAALGLKCGADDELSLEVATKFALGDEMGVKKAIHELLFCDSPTTLTSYNAVAVVCLLLIRISGEAEEEVWMHHFNATSEYARCLQEAREKVEKLNSISFQFTTFLKRSLNANLAVKC